MGASVAVQPPTRASGGDCHAANHKRVILRRTRRVGPARCLELRTGAARGVRDRAGPPFHLRCRLGRWRDRLRDPRLVGNRCGRFGNFRRFRRRTGRGSAAAVRGGRRTDVATLTAKGRQGIARPGGTRWRFDERPQDWQRFAARFHEIEDERRARRPRQARGDPAGARRADRRGAPADRGRAGRRQDDARQGHRPLDRLLVPPDPVHARPAADRRHRRQRLQPGARRLRVQARRDLREHRARRRDQPRQPRRRSRRCSSAWRSGRSRSTPRPTRSARRSW